MKLRQFRASGVHGYLRFSLEFNEALTFVTGANGSGKSTALQLIEALLTPSLKELALTEFAEAEIAIEDMGLEKRIRASKTHDSLSIAADWVDEVLVLNDLGRDQVNVLAEDLRTSEEYFRNLSISLASSRVLKAIGNIAAPVFLGIERRHRVGRGDEQPMHEVHFLDGPSRRGVHARRLLKGNLAPGLAETQGLVQEAYRKARRQVDSAQETLRNDVLLSAFHYSEASRDAEGNLSFHEFAIVPDFDLKATRKDIETALLEIGLPENKVQDRIGAFFEKLSTLIAKTESPSDKDRDSFIELLMNKGQLDRLKVLISMVQDQKKRTDGVFRKLHSFVDTVNWFFRDSGKTVSLDAVGRIEVARPDGVRIPFDALSSGERQLIIIFAHLYFNAFGSRSRVFVIDEPELSLHLRWQENLVAKAQESAPGMQLVLATHSPDIVGDRSELCVAVD